MRLLLLLSALAPCWASSQLIVLEFTDGGTFSYDIDQVRSVELSSGDKVVNLFNGTVLSWPIASIERELVGDITTEVAEGHGPPDLLSIYPNPASGPVNISFSLEHAGPVDVTIHDAQGRLVRRLMQGERSAGEVLLVWDGTGSSGGDVAPGCYMVNVQRGQIRITRSIMITD